MNKVLVCLLTASAIVVLCMAVRGETESETKPAAMISHLKVGQQVRALGNSGGGYNIEIPNAMYIKSFESKRGAPKYVTSKITEIGSDFITLSSANGSERTIAFHAIDVITKLPEMKAEAEDAAQK